MSSLNQETPLDLTTAARVNSYIGGNRVAGTDATALGLVIKALSKDAMLKILRRGIERKTRVEYLDIQEAQRNFYLLGYPIDSAVAVAVVHNVDQPRVWTDAGDVVDSDYVVVDHDSGLITIEKTMTAAVRGLKVTYRGGMATGVSSGEAGSGTDGAVTGTYTFESAAATFETYGVAAGDPLVITGGTNAGTYTVASVESETALTVAEAFPDTSSTGETWSLTAAAQGLVTLYPDVAFAMDMQIAHIWQNKLKFGLQSQGIVGASYSFIRGGGWLREARELMLPHARVVA